MSDLPEAQRLVRWGKNINDVGTYYMPQLLCKIVVSVFFNYVYSMTMRYSDQQLGKGH